jgi:putative transposase
MQPISYARHQFPPEIIRHATWLYLRFTLSYRDVEELLAEVWRSRTRLSGGG